MITKEKIIDFLQTQKEELFANGITQLGLFGSYARDENNTFSDIDIFIQSDAEFISKKFNNPLYFFVILDNLKAKIVAQFGTTADICDISSMNNDEKIKFLKKAIYV